MQNLDFKIRRELLLQQLSDKSAVIIFAAKEVSRSGRENYPFRQNSDFYYLTGLVDPEAIAILLPRRVAGSFILFNRERDLDHEIWYSPRIGQERACNEFGADQAFKLSEIDQVLPKLLVGCNEIYFNFNDDLKSTFERRIISWIKHASPTVDLDRLKLHNLDKILHEMRLRKSRSELTILRKAAEITTKAHLRAMQKCKPGMYEFELEAELLYEFNRHGGNGEAFATIVAGGANACTLHYSKNDQRLLDGELVLVDAGVEHGYYCADVTRTFPVNGQFTKEQRSIYEIVLTVQNEIIKQIRPGIHWGDLQLLSERLITRGLVDIGLLQGEVNELIATKSFMPFFMHKFGHWLGIDAHDVGDYSVDNKWRILQPGMVFTVEPGIYISPQASHIEKRWRGIGVRIEDDVLVTEDGSEVLTNNLPKGVSEIESVINNN